MRIVMTAVLLAASVTGLATAGGSADVVTMRVRSTVVRYNEPAVVTGATSGGKENEYVSVEGKVCGVPAPFFRALGGASTIAGGAWTAEVRIPATTTLRADWNGVKSEEVTVQSRINVWLLREAGGLRVGASNEIGGMDLTRVTIQRLTPTGWKLVRRIVLRDEGHPLWVEKKGLRFGLPKGTTIRAVVPLSQAKPCYLAGYSKIVRT